MKINQQKSLLYSKIFPHLIHTLDHLKARPLAEAATRKLTLSWIPPLNLYACRRWILRCCCCVQEFQLQSHRHPLDDLSILAISHKVITSVVRDPLPLHKELGSRLLLSPSPPDWKDGMTKQYSLPHPGHSKNCTVLLLINFKHKRKAQLIVENTIF